MVNFFIHWEYVFNEITKPPSDGSQRFIVSYSADFPFLSAVKELVCIRGMLFVWFYQVVGFLFIQQLCDDMTGTAGTFIPRGSFWFLCFFIRFYCHLFDCCGGCSSFEM